MTRAEMLAKLHRQDLTGVGVYVEYTDPERAPQYYFYEDFEGSKGIDRAAYTFIAEINRGLVRRATYIYA